jgi:hypothetical protein
VSSLTLLAARRRPGRVRRARSSRCYCLTIPLPLIGHHLRGDRVRSVQK